MLKTWPSLLDPFDPDTLGAKLILAIIVSALFICPLTFQLSHLEDDNVQTDLFAAVLALILSGSIICIVHNIFKQRCQSVEIIQTEDKFPKIKIFKVFSSSSLSSSFLTSSKVNHTKSTNAPKEQTPESTDSSKKPKVDPKYFKPKYIIHELLDIWGTTYTVITWGSFWVIGGTIVATEKLATRIKTKCSRDPDVSSANLSSTSDSRYNNANRASSPSLSGRDPLRATRSWTRKSFATARRKLFRCFRTNNIPQLTEVTSNPAL